MLIGSWTSTNLNPSNWRNLVGSAVLRFRGRQSARGPRGPFSRPFKWPACSRVCLEYCPWFVSTLISVYIVCPSRYWFYRYRTPLCLLYPPKAIAAACYILAQRIADGTDSASLDERVSSAALTVASSNIPPQGHISVGSPHSAFEFFNFSDSDLKSVAGMTYQINFQVCTNNRN